MPTSLSVFMLKKTTEWATLDLCLSSHKELLQDGGIRMLVLQLPSCSLGGQKPHLVVGSLRFVSPGFVLHHVCLCCRMQISELWWCQPFCSLDRPCWDTGCHSSSHTLVLVNIHLATHTKSLPSLSISLVSLSSHLCHPCWHLQALQCLLLNI